VVGVAEKRKLGMRLVAALLAVRHLAGLLDALSEQLCDAGIGDSDPAAATAGAVPGESAADNLVRFLANPALRVLSLAAAGPAGTGAAYELTVAVVLAVLPLGCALLVVEPARPAVCVVVSGFPSAAPASRQAGRRLAVTVAPEPSHTVVPQQMWRG
jgi:hypothetical protein